MSTFNDSPDPEKNGAAPTTPSKSEKASCPPESPNNFETTHSRPEVNEIEKLLAAAQDAMQDSGGFDSLPDHDFSVDSGEFKSTELSDVGNATRIAEQYGHNVRFCNGHAFIWNRLRWKPADPFGPEIMALARSTSARFLDVALRYAAESKDDLALKFALDSRNHSRLRAACKQLSSFGNLQIENGEIDADPYRIGALNSIIDLKAGCCIPPGRDDYITRSLSTTYNPEATCIRWLQFIDEVTDGDKDLADFLQRAVGYSLLGHCEHHVLFLITGPGRNGKGVFLRTLFKLLGSYAHQAPEELFFESRGNSSRIANSLAELVGKRLVILPEVPQDKHLAEGRVKQLTGGDAITAHKLYGADFTFLPSHTIWISGNTRPPIRGADCGIWDRLRLIPFRRRFVDNACDPNLEENLLLELPGILNWAIEGSLSFQQHGLPLPTCMKDLLAEYQTEENPVAGFIQETLVPQGGGRTLRTQIYSSYKQWASRPGLGPVLSARAFYQHLEASGICFATVNGQRYVRDYAIKFPQS